MITQTSIKIILAIMAAGAALAITLSVVVNVVSDGDKSPQVVAFPPDKGLERVPVQNSPGKEF